MDWTRIDDSLADPNGYATTEYHEVYRLLRDEDPVHLSPGVAYSRPFWYTTRYDDVNEILMRPDRFSSRLSMGRIPRSPKRVTPEERHEMGFDLVADVDQRGPRWVPETQATGIMDMTIRHHGRVAAAARA